MVVGFLVLEQFSSCVFVAEMRWQMKRGGAKKRFSNSKDVHTDGEAGACVRVLFLAFQCLARFVLGFCQSNTHPVWCIWDGFVDEPG